MQKNYKTRI